jgi:hypothetical protein
VDGLEEQVKELRRASAGAARIERVPAGGVSRACAEEIAARVIAHCDRSGCLEAIAPDGATRDAVMGFARERLGINTKAALTTSDIPLPAEYGREVAMLTSQFGVARKRMTRYPIGRGTARPARLGTAPSFGSIAMNASFSEKSPTMNFASLESHKIGGMT